MGRFPALLLLCASAALAQGFSGLATNRDGSVLYFSSASRMKGTSQYLHRKIFRWDAGAVSLFEERPNDYLSISSTAVLGRFYFDLTTPDVSADGSTVSFVGFGNCWSGSICLSTSAVAQTSIYSLNAAHDQPLALAGLGALSPNGRYAAAVTPVLTFPGFGAAINVIDRQTGQMTGAYTSVVRTAGKRWIANDGTFLLSTANGLALANGTDVRPVPNSSAAAFAMVNDAADLVLFERPGALTVFSFRDGASRDLVTGPLPNENRNQFGASMSYDGSRIAFIYERQVYVVGSDGSGLRQAARFEQGIVEVVLSGDGVVAIAITADNRIVRVNIGAGTVMEMVPPTPFVSSAPLPQERGHVQTLRGAGFASESREAAAPYPLTLNGVELRIQGAPIPLVAVAPGSISYAVPWDFPETPNDVLEIEIWTSAGNNSPWISGFEGVAGTPYFASFSAIHEDFSSIVTRDRPAKPGEIVHLYARNLGPVNPAPSPALPVPLQTLPLLTTPLTCFFGKPDVPLDVVFAGLAPTMVDIFQVDVRLPASSANTVDRIGCRLGDPAVQNDIPGFGPLVWVGAGAPEASLYGWRR